MGIGVAAALVAGRGTSQPDIRCSRREADAQDCSVVGLGER